MATSVVPRGKLERLHREGKSMPAGWAINIDGTVMTEMSELINGLINRRGYGLLPLGGAGETLSGHKGFGLGLLVDLLCGPLSGAAWGRHVYDSDGANLGQVFIALRVDCFRDPADFDRESAQLLDEIRASKKVKGHDRIYIPGEKEVEEMQRRQHSGIPIQSSVQADLAQIADEIGITL